MTLVDINGVRIDRIIAEQIPIIINRVLKKDFDKYFVIDGREGSGKSVLAMQLAKVLDLKFTIDKIAFNSEQFINLIKSPTTKKGDCILLDEAFSAANARASLSDVNKAMIGVGTEMRQLNLFVIIVLPTFFDLDRYFAIWRCDTLLHVFLDKKGNRGSYTIYPFDEKLNLYIHGKKTYNYKSWNSPYPPCKFINQWIVDEQEYRKRKVEAFRTRKKRLGVYELRWRERTNKAINFMTKHYGLTASEIGGILEMEADDVRKTQEMWRKGFVRE